MIMMESVETVFIAVVACVSRVESMINEAARGRCCQYLLSAPNLSGDAVLCMYHCTRERRPLHIASCMRRVARGRLQTQLVSMQCVLSRASMRSTTSGAHSQLKLF